MSEIIVKYLETVPKSDQWQLKQDIPFEVKLYGKVIVPAGYITDFASSPRILWWLIPPIGKYNRATIIHDFLYENRIIAFGKILDDSTARQLADETFLEIANQTNPKAKVLHHCMYLTIRIFGKFYWIKNN